VIRALATTVLVLGLSSLAACGDDQSNDDEPGQSPSIGSNVDSDDGDDQDDQGDDQDDQDDQDDD